MLIIKGVCMMDMSVWVPSAAIFALKEHFIKTTSISFIQKDVHNDLVLKKLL